MTTLVVFLLFISLDSTSAQIGGGLDTDTTLSIPSNLEDGDSVTVTSTTTFASGPVFFGQTTFYHLDDIRIKGATDIGTSISITDPTLEFSVGFAMTLRAIRIPITTISIDSVLDWVILDSGSTVIADGEINPDELNFANQEGNLMVVIGSLQSDDSNDDNKYASGISLTSGTYSITLSQSSVLDFTASASSSYQGVYSYENSILQNTYPQLYLLGGSHRERVSVINGAASSTFNVNEGISYVLAYYGDYGNNFAPSHDFVQLQVADTSPLTVSLPDYSSSPGSSVILTANVLDGANPVNGAVVDFSLLENGINNLIGSSTTNAVGDAQISYTANLDSGSYEIVAEARYSSRYGMDTSSLEIQPPVAVWENLQAIASYGSAGFGLSSAVISGTIKTSGGNPIVDTPVSIFDSSGSVTTVSSNSLGYFEYSQVINQAVGSYAGYYTVNITDGFWDSASVSTDLTLNHGQLFVNTNDVTTEFINQPEYIAGDISNIPGEDVVSTINLEMETSPGTWSLMDTVTGSSFNFTLDINSAGSYNYRIRIDETATWMSIIKSVIVQIGQSNALTTRNGQPTSFDIEYHQNYDLSVYILQDDLTAIEGASVTVSAWNPTVSDYYIITTGVSDTNGLAPLSWTPEDKFLQFPFLDFPIKYTSVHNDFVVTDLQVSFRLVRTDISVSLLENNWIYDTENTIVFDTIDSYGFAANQGTQFDVTIEGVTYPMIIDSEGQGSVNHRFTTVGSTSLNIVTSNPNPFPYNIYSDNLLYTIDKGSYIISGMDEMVSRGDTYLFVSTITDHNGNDLSSPTIASLWVFDVTWTKMGDTSSTSNFAIPADIILNEGVYSIEWRIDGNSVYKPTSQSYSLTVTKSSTEILLTNVPLNYDFNDIAANREVSLLLQIPILDIPIASQFVTITFISADDGYNWFLQTDVTGIITFTLPQQPITGNYLLNITYAGDTNYISSTNSVSLDVLGVDTSLSWKIVPVDGYYAEEQLFSLHAEDGFGNDLIGFTVEVTIGSDVFSVVTNSTGDASFNINMVYEGSVGIHVELQAKDGWNGQSVDISVQIEKKQLAISSNINSVYYSPTNNNQDLDIELIISSNNDLYLSNIKLELYWLDPATSTFDFIDFYYTDQNGYIYQTLRFPAISAGQSYMFRWTASDSDFLPAQLDHIYTITAMPLSITVDYTSGSFGLNTLIDFTITDQNGILLNDLEIYMSYTETVIFWSDTATTVLGRASIIFVAPNTGNLLVYYMVTDINGNYVVTEDNINITITKSSTNIDYILLDNQGIIFLTIDVHDSINNQITEGIVIIDRFDGIWTLDKTVDLALTNITQINMYSDTMMFRLRYIDNSHYIQNTIFFDIYRQNIDISHQRFDMKVEDGLLLYIELSGNSTLDGYELELLIYDDVSLQWDSYGTLYSTNGIINTVVPINLPIGSYNLRIIVPEQGWYYEYDNTFVLNIIFNDFTFSIDTDVFVSNTQSQLITTINTTANNAVDGVELSLYIIIGSDSILLDTTITDSFGNASFVFTINYQYGIYDFYIRSTQTQFIDESTYLFEGTVGFIPSMSLTIYDDFVFDQDGSIGIFVKDHLGYNIDTSNIDVFYSLYDPLSQSYLTPVFLSTLLTDIDGYVFAIIPYEILNSANITLTLVLNNQYNVGPDSFEFEILVERSTPVITNTITDYGVTQSADIEFIVINNQNMSVNGSIKWYLKTSSNVVVLSGEYVLTNIDGTYLTTINIPATYIGAYTLVIDYHDTNSLIKYHDTSIIIDIGWTRVGSVVSSSTMQLVYMDSSSLNFTVLSQDGKFALGNIEVEMLVGGNRYSGITDSNGFVSFDVDLLPGEYQVNFIIKDSIFVNDIDETYELRVLKGKSSVQLDAPADIPAIAPLVIINIRDLLEEDSTVNVYSVQIYRDGNIIDDVDWQYDLGTITIFPIYSQSNALSTQSNHEGHLYPGTYRVELTRYNPLYDNITVTQEFIILPMDVEFRYEIKTINETDYLIILYPNDTVVDVEFSTRLRNDDLSETEFFTNTDMILIPWDRGTISISIDGTGYVSGHESGHHTIETYKYNTTSSATNSTGSYGESGFGSSLDVNSIQVIGGIAIVATAAIAPARKYLKRRK
ncbi:MAG: hypothetical protein GPJ54_17755 [Candidatus Heimdallarchaeota archaeon]|nr:hypothetical protein [Candidatus Heimdallarchaeota archaeon]